MNSFISDLKRLAMMMIFSSFLMWGFILVAWIYCHAALWLMDRFPQAHNVDVLLLVGMGYWVMINLIAFIKIIHKKYL